MPHGGSLKQSAHYPRLVICDYQFSALLSLPVIVRYAVFDAQIMHGKAVKHPPDIRVIVDADHGFALDATEYLGHFLVLLPAKWHAVSLGLPVRRIHIEEGVGAIVAADAVLPGEVFHRGAAGEAQMRG